MMSLKVTPQHVAAKLGWLTRAVTHVISKCNPCRRVTGESYKYPGPPPLPESRVHLSTPFHTTGVDYTGASQLSKTASGLPLEVGSAEVDPSDSLMVDPESSVELPPPLEPNVRPRRQAALQAEEALRQQLIRDDSI